MGRLNTFVGFIKSIVSVGYDWLIYRIKNNTNNNEKIEKEYVRTNYYYRALNVWAHCLIRGCSIGEYLKNKGISTVAIYGWGELGKRTCEDIERIKAIEIKNVIDKNGKMLECKYTIVTDVTEISEQPQLIIVTPFLEFEGIKRHLQSKGVTNAMILSLEDILYDMKG